ncbi:hypothetical protein PV326_014122 [Microctonus aethiopoides]|nr:hypothetical protein PV326_014122 [Microctonus aethiopoides]
MARNLINRVNHVLNQIEQIIGSIFGGNFPPAVQCAVTCGHHDYVPKISQKSNASISLKDIIGDGFMWAVPKTRRSVEVRLSRKFGFPEKHWKMLVPKKNLLMCPSCGHDHEAGLLCNHCYTRVKVETEEMQKVIVDTLSLKPVEKEVVVLYEGETQSNLKDYWKGQRIIELPKKRPAWFHSNLLQPTTEEPSTSKDVKPIDLA